MLTNIIPAYLYTQYNDDANLQALIDVYNHNAQEIYDWLATTPFPVFTSEKMGGDLLTWAVKGIYGADRPVLLTPTKPKAGLFNDLLYNALPYNTWKEEEDGEQITGNDELFRRILVWNFYRGDGYQFSVPWLKRRILRFLTGRLGGDGSLADHSSVSVRFEEDVLRISIKKVYYRLLGYGLFNAQVYNTRAYNDISMRSSSTVDYPYATLFERAFNSGLLHMPFYLNQISINVDDA